MVILPSSINIHFTRALAPYNPITNFGLLRKIIIILFVHRSVVRFHTRTKAFKHTSEYRPKHNENWYKFFFSFCICTAYFAWTFLRFLLPYYLFIKFWMVFFFFSMLFTIMIAGDSPKCGKQKREIAVNFYKKMKMITAHRNKFILDNNESRNKIWEFECKNVFWKWIGNKKMLLLLFDDDDDNNEWHSFLVILSSQFCDTKTRKICKRVMMKILFLVCF